MKQDVLDFLSFLLKANRRMKQKKAINAIVRNRSGNLWIDGYMAALEDAKHFVESYGTPREIRRRIPGAGSISNAGVCCGRKVQAAKTATHNHASKASANPGCGTKRNVPLRLREKS